MARRPRLVAGGVPVHVLWRGTAGTAITRDDDDRARLLQEIRAAALSASMRVHAYVLMPDHLHLVLTVDQAPALSAALQAVGRSYVRHLNRRHGRSGTLWEGRYRSTMLEPSAWVLPCLRYVEQNPVRAGLTATAESYPWSSHRHWVGLSNESWLSQAPDYWELGNTPFERQDRWRRWCHDESPAPELSRLRWHAHTGWPLGSPAFLQGLEDQLGYRQAPASAGRPKKRPSSA
jgi:putative transposase